MNPTLSHTLKKIPFIRLLLPLMAGILFQWYVPVEVKWWYWQGAVVLLLILLSERLSLSNKFFLRKINGLALMYLLFLMGAVLLHQKDVRNDPHWYGHGYHGQPVVVALSEPLIKKANSFKAEAKVIAIKNGGRLEKAEGKILLYFKKDIDTGQLSYGTTLLINRSVQPIKNSSNPGAFDYNRYCLFQGITGQVFLEEASFAILPQKETNFPENTLISIRLSTIGTIRTYITGKDEQAIAEALLIGYRHDLDKDIVQAYSNTGVVHIIAISGLHLGMIYGLLLLLLPKTSSLRIMRWIKPVIILSVLWSFTLIAGAVPSILRSAVMFSFIVVAENLNRKTQTYNTLAASAFCLLTVDPFVLWDVGFILSYTAVLSIISFLKPITNWFYFRNKPLEKIWQLTAVTLSAQVFTIPVVIYYFHQFPNFFLLTNLLVVPLSGLILYGEIFLLVLSPFTPVAASIGSFIGILIGWMNGFILFINDIPHSLLKNLQISIFQTWLLIAIIIAFVAWIQFKQKKAFLYFLVFVNLFAGSLALQLVQSRQQQKIVVYDVPKFSAIDFVQGNQYHFMGDEILKKDSALRNFHLQPARISALYNHPSEREAILNQVFTFNNRKCLIIDASFSKRSESKIPLDILIISKNPSIEMQELSESFSFQHLVIDSSVPRWKTEKWKKDCEMLHLPFYSVSMQGAFVLDYTDK